MKMRKFGAAVRLQKRRRISSTLRYTWTSGRYDTAAPVTQSYIFTCFYFFIDIKDEISCDAFCQAGKVEAAGEGEAGDPNAENCGRSGQFSNLMKHSKAYWQ